MFGKAITYKTKTKCLADKYEASVGPAENLSASVRRISKTLNYLVVCKKNNISFILVYFWKLFLQKCMK